MYFLRFYTIPEKKKFLAGSTEETHLFKDWRTLIIIGNYLLLFE